MAIQVEKNSEGKKTFVVYCDGIDSRGRRIQLRRRGVKTEKEARAVEFELRRQIANQKDQAPSYTWNEWFQICLERMRLEFKPSTIVEYLGKHNNWIQPVIGEKLLDEVTPQDVHDIVYSNKTDVTWYTRRGTLRRIHRIRA